MGDELQLAMRVATVVLNFSAAIAFGAATASLLLSAGAAPWAAGKMSKLRQAGLAGLMTAMLASAVLLLFEAALMAEVPVGQAGEALWSMLTATHLGTAWMIGTAALAASMAATLAAGAGARVTRVARRRYLAPLALLGLAVFLYTRSMVSHATSDGDFSAAMLADWLHLVFISLWAGEVFVAGGYVLASPVGHSTDDCNAAARYIESLSASATFALAGIAATGVVSAWHNLGSAAALTGSAYGATLLVKVGLAALAVLMGGYNRFFVMPSLLQRLRGNEPGAAGVRRFTLILRFEALVLLGVLVMAALLSSTIPPRAA